MAVRLASGAELPLVGFGTARLRRDKGRAALAAAVDSGFRHFDTAKVYGNERLVGEVLRSRIASGVVRRCDLFVTSKLWNDDHRNVRDACQASLDRLGLEYLDLYLIHWPTPWRKGTLFCPDDGATLEETWREMERLVEDGLVRAIGVSNFGITDLVKLLELARTKPAVLQVELHPFLAQQSLVSFCLRHDIAVTAWSPLCKLKRTLLDDPVLGSVASAKGWSLPRVVLRWNIQRGVCVIPRSSSPTHIAANLEALHGELSESEMVRINALDTGSRCFPDVIGVFEETHYIFSYVGALLALLARAVWYVMPNRLDLKMPE